MIKFVTKNWKMLLVSTLATTAAAVCIFNPPAFIAASISGLSSSAVFSIFGAYAAQAATATIALAAAASTFLGATVLNAGYNLASRLVSACWARVRPTGSTETGKSNSTNEDNFDEDLGNGERSSKKLGSLGGSRVRTSTLDRDPSQGGPFYLTGPGKKKPSSSLTEQPVESDEELDTEHTATLGGQ